MSGRYSQKVSFQPTIRFGQDDEESGSASRPAAEPKKETSFRSELKTIGESLDRASKFVDDFAPPYAPRLSAFEMRMLAKFINKKEERLTALKNDPRYIFLLQVAHASHRDIESLLKFRTKDEYFPFKGVGIPSHDYVDDLRANRQPINETIVQALMERKFQQVKMMFEQQAERTRILAESIKEPPATATDTIVTFLGFSGGESRNAKLFNPGFPTFNSSQFPQYDGEQVRKTIEYYRTNLNFMKILARPLSQTFGDGQLEDLNFDQLKEVSKTVFLSPNGSKDELVRALKERKDSILVFQDLQGVVEVRKKLRDAGDGTNTDSFESDLDISKLLPAFSNPQIPLLSILFTKENVIPSKEFQLADRIVEDLLASESQVTHSTSRERMYSAMQWIGQPENLGYADMSEALVGAINMAITRLTMNVPSLTQLDNYLQVVNSGNNAFITLFAELVGKLIAEPEITVPTRAQLDAAEERIMSRIRRLLFAFRRFAFRNGKIVMNGVGTNCSRTVNSALYAYR